MLLPKIKVIFTMNDFTEARCNSVWDNGAKVSERTPGGSCLSWRMCLSSPFRMMTTTFLKQAGETVVEGMHPITLFITSFGVLSNKIMVQEETTQNSSSRTVMYFTSNRHSEFHQNLCRNQPLRTPPAGLWCISLQIDTLNFIRICVEINQAHPFFSQRYSSSLWQYLILFCDVLVE